MPCKSPDFHQKSFRIKHEDDKFFSRLVSKESSSSKSNSSCRVYYADVPSAVPFIWETRPGTPKHAFSDNFTSIPASLTPPPSYYTNVNLNNSSSKTQSRSKLLLHTLLGRMKLKKDGRHFHLASSSSPNSLSWSSSSHSSFSTDPIMTPTRRRRFLSCGSSFEMDYHNGDEGYFPSRIEKNNTGEKVQSTGSSVLVMKKALLSIFGRGSA